MRDQRINFPEPFGFPSVELSPRHSTLVQGYQAYANGGASADDARLATLAELQARQARQNLLDGENAKGLFGWDGASSEKEEGATTRSTTRRVPDGNGGWRTQYMEYYPAGGSSSETSSAKEPEVSLLD